MKILVTGGTGFIGSRLIEALVQRGQDEVVCTGRKNPPLAKGPVQFRQGDLGEESFAVDSCRGIDAIVHCAGLAGTWGPDKDYERANVQATQFLLKGARAHGVQRIVNISSPSVYFDFRDQLNLRETDLPRKFSNAYARTKYQAEKLMQAHHGPELQTISLRPRSVIGRGDQNILPRLIRLQQAGHLAQLGDGHNLVDITTVGNLIDAIFLCLQASSDAWGETYNISNGQPVRFWDFVESVLHQANLPLKRKRLPLAPVMALARANEFWNRWIGRKSEPTLLPVPIGILAYSMTMDISKARERLGYRPRWTTEDGVREFFEDKGSGLTS